MTKRPGARNQLGAFALVSPSLVGVVAFVVAPLALVIWLASQSWNLIDAPRFVGAQNIASVFDDPDFWNSAAVTAGLVAVIVPIEVALALAIAVILSRRRRGRRVVRAILVLPWVAAPLALGVIWNWIFAPTGGVFSGLVGQQLDWIADPAGARLIVATVTIWSQVGYLSLFFSAGLLAIPVEIDEAAVIDGTSGWQRLRLVTMPLLRPTLFFVAVTASAQAAAMFDQVYSLTGGGPGRSTEVLGLRIFRDAFTTFDLGQAAVTALFLMVALGVLALVSRRLIAGSARAGSSRA